MYRWSLTIFASFLFLANVSAQGRADTFESPAAIRAAVQTAAERQLRAGKDETLEFEVGEVDSRLRLAACAQPEVAIPMANVVLLAAQVTCRQPFWTLYVPIRVHAWSRAVVAAGNLAPGTKLTASDLTLARLDVLATSGAYITDPEQAEGMILRANVRAGAPILTPLLERPILIHRGDTVVLTLFASTMTIRTSAVAMEDGRRGDHITVENADSKKTLRAAVADPGAVEVRFDDTGENR
jgi:flagella basal body P-ring formation protein FlgA